MLADQPDQLISLTKNRLQLNISKMVICCEKCHNFLLRVNQYCHSIIDMWLVTLKGIPRFKKE